MKKFEDIYEIAMNAFARAGGCVKRLTVDIGGGQMVTFVRDRNTIGILG
jgi:hypothetical protein